MKAFCSNFFPPVVDIYPEDVTMSEMPSITTPILIDIRDELRGVREGVHEVRNELHEVRNETRQNGEELTQLTRRVDLLAEGQIRGHTILAQMAEDLHAAVGWIANHNDLRPRLERCESEIDVIKKRLG